MPKPSPVWCGVVSEKSNRKGLGVFYMRAKQWTYLINGCELVWMALKNLNSYMGNIYGRLAKFN